MVSGKLLESSPWVSFSAIHVHMIYVQCGSVARSSRVQSGQETNYWICLHICRGSFIFGVEEAAGCLDLHTRTKILCITKLRKKDHLAWKCNGISKGMPLYTPRTNIFFNQGSIGTD